MHGNDGINPNRSQNCAGIQENQFLFYIGQLSQLCWTFKVSMTTLWVFRLFMEATCGILITEVNIPNFLI